MKELNDLCVMCEKYLEKCSREEIRMRKSETWDGFMLRIESCPDYVRVKIDHNESR